MIQQVAMLLLLCAAMPGMFAAALSALMMICHARYAAARAALATRYSVTRFDADALVYSEHYFDAMLYARSVRYHHMLIFRDFLRRLC